MHLTDEPLAARFDTHQLIHYSFRAVFTSSVETNSHLLWFCIATLRHFVIQSEVKPKPIVTTIARKSFLVLCVSYNICLEFDWLTGLSLSFVID